MSEIVFFLEEASAEALLEGLLPRLLPTSWSYRCVVFEGKQDMEAQLMRRIRGYRNPGARFIVLRDQDSNNCMALKQRLLALCRQAGRSEAMVRIACHELETFYLADLAAVEAGMKIQGIAQYQEKRKFRSPDDFPSPFHTLKQLVPRYQKISGSRAIGPHLQLENRRSSSFAALVAAVKRNSGVNDDLTT